MKHKTLNESVKEYMDDFLEHADKGESWTNIDWLVLELNDFSLSQNPSQNGGVIKTDLVGNQYKNAAFTYSMVFEYSEDIETMLLNGEMLESLTYYIKEKNNKREYPKLSRERIATDFNIVQTPFLSHIDEGNTLGVYVIILNLAYIEPR